MVNTCSVVYCKTGCKKRENKEDKVLEGLRIVHNIEMEFKPSASSLL